jgi:drug/metabolite transporter (DMT)-like permease
MDITTIAAGISVAILIALGQIALKGVANLQASGLPTIRVVLSWQLALAFLAYGLNIVLWLWVLSHTSLSAAYPFALLGSALVPIGAAVFLREHLSAKFAIGFALVLLGVGFAING